MKRLELLGAALAFTLATAGCSGGSSSDPADAEIRVSPISGPITEAGAEASFSVVLNAKPKSDVTINLTSADVTEGTVSPAAATFTNENWDAPQTVLVTGVDDAAADGNVTFDVAMTVDSSDSNYSALELSPVAVLNLDDETAGVRVGPVSGVTSEGGGQVVIPVVLQSEPADDVVLIFGTSDLTEGTTDSMTLTFTPLDWNAPQNITVTGEDDEVPDGVVNYSILFQNTFSDDPVYSGIPIPAVSLGNVDDDTPGILMTPNTAVTDESDDTTPSVTISVRLATPPAANVTLVLDETDSFEGDLPTTTVTMTFTAANWNVAQTTTVTGEEDFVADGDQPYKIIISSVTTTDTAYAAVPRPEVNLVNLDNDSPGIRVSPLSSVADETGGFSTFTIDLLTQPTAPVTLGMSVSEGSEARISHSSHTFSTSSWDDPVTVWVSGVEDGIPDGNQPWFVAFTPAVSTDPNYAGRKPANLSGFTLDDAPLRRAIVYDDAMGSEADEVFAARGWMVELVTTATALENAVDAGGADLVLVESATAMLPASTEASLDNWVSGGGRLILSHWDLDSTLTLTSALDVSVNPYSGHRFVFPAPIGLADVFLGLDEFPYPLTGQSAGIDGQELVPGATGVLAARVDSLSGPGSVALTRSGQVFVNGFAPDDMAGTDNDGDGIPDMRELYANEIAYLLRGGSPVTFSTDVPKALKDGDAAFFTTSTIQVHSIPTAPTKVTVAVHLAHTDSGEMDVFLRGPDGVTRVELATDVGDTDNDGFGAGCRATDAKLVFDDAGPAITAPAAGAVVGTFRPEGASPNNLSAFNGLDPNGTWTLEVADDSGFNPFDFGAIRCWSLILTF